MKNYVLIFQLILRQFLSKLYVEKPRGVKNLFQYQNQYGSLEYSISTFGNILYNEQDEISVYAPQIDNQYGCQGILNKPKDQKERFFYIVKRGVCTYSKKAYLAQQNGAFGVLVYHDKPYESVSDIIPCADSLYNNVKIPIILLNKEQGEILYQQAQQQNGKISLILDMEIDQKKEDFLDVEFWLNPTSIQSYKFLIDFHRVNEQFQELIKFVPKYKFKNLSSNEDKDFLKDHCYQKGNFCQDDDYDAQQVLEEGIRQICVFQQQKEDEKQPYLWWKYIKVYSLCLKKIDTKIGEKKLDCYKEIKKILNLSQQTENDIQMCMERSFEKKDKFESTNILLEQNQNQGEYSDVYLIPALFINDFMVKEELTSVLVTSALCQRLKHTPLICNSFHNEIHWNRHTLDSVYEMIKMGIILVFLGIVLFLLVLVLMKINFKRDVNKKLQNDIQQHISQYMKIQDDKIVNQFQNILHINNVQSKQKSQFFTC